MGLVLLEHHAVHLRGQRLHAVQSLGVSNGGGRDTLYDWLLYVVSCTVSG